MDRMAITLHKIIISLPRIVYWSINTLRMYQGPSYMSWAKPSSRAGRSTHALSVSHKIVVVFIWEGGLARLQRSRLLEAKSRQAHLLIWTQRQCYKETRREPGQPGKTGLPGWPGSLASNKQALRNTILAVIQNVYGFIKCGFDFFPCDWSLKRNPLFEIKSLPPFLGWYEVFLVSKSLSSNEGKLFLWRAFVYLLLSCLDFLGVLDILLYVLSWDFSSRWDRFLCANIKWLKTLFKSNTTNVNNRGR